MEPLGSVVQEVAVSASNFYASAKARRSVGESTTSSTDEAETYWALVLIF